MILGWCRDSQGLKWHRHVLHHPTQYNMVKEYTLKVVVRVGGETEEECDDKMASLCVGLCAIAAPPEITHEEVVQCNDEVERE